MLTFGAESGSERVLKMINKKASAEHVLEVNRRLARSNIIPHFVTIRGFPTESAEEMQQTYRLLCDLILANPKTICDSPQLITTPGTKIAEMCLGDLTHSYTLEDWAEVFDLFAGKKPNWIMDETWDFLRDHDMLLNVMYAASSPEQGIKRYLGRLLLSIYARLLASPAGGRIFNSMLKTLFRQS
jgi:radical SAM superfamily enzyme YgiQ (UPF0313 family)